MYFDPRNQSSDHAAVLRSKMPRAIKVLYPLNVKQHVNFCVCTWLAQPCYTTIIWSLHNLVLSPVSWNIWTLILYHFLRSTSTRKETTRYFPPCWLMQSGIADRRMLMKLLALSLSYHQVNNMLHTSIVLFITASLIGLDLFIDFCHIP